MTLEPDQLTRTQPELDKPGSGAGLRLWGVVAAAALGVVAVIGVSAALATNRDSTDARPGIGTNPSTAAAPGPSDGQPSSAAEHAAGGGFPVTLPAPGWTCDEPADEKFACFKGAAAVLVTVRPASSHDAYLTDPDKASPDQYVSDVHDGVFATLNRMPDDRTTDVFALGASLAWANQ